MGKIALLRSKRAGLFSFLIILALLIGAFLIIKGKGYDIKNPSGLFSFLGDFFSWLFQIGRNTFNIAGYAIRQNWTPAGINLSNVSNITRNRN